MGESRTSGKKVAARGGNRRAAATTARRNKNTGQKSPRPTAASARKHADLERAPAPAPTMTATTAPAPAAPPIAAPSLLAGRVRQLEDQLAAVCAIGAAHARCVGLDALFSQIVPNISRLMHAERTTLFLYDRTTGEIWSKVAEGEGHREIRLECGEGLAGWVAEHCEKLNIPDAYADSRFNPLVDVRTGFTTRSVAAVPLTFRQGELLGVLQALNHADGPFTDEDMALLETIAVQTAYAVENAQLADRLIQQNRELEAERAHAEQHGAELDLLYQLERETSASTELDQLLSSVVVRACERLRSEAGSVLILDEDSGKLFFRAAKGPRGEELRRIALNPGEGVVGWVAEKGEPLIVNHPANDPRHGQELAKKIDYPVEALLAVPLVWNERIIGAMEVLNPAPKPGVGRGYDLDDLKLLTIIAGQVARAVSLTIERQIHLDLDRLAAVGRMLAGVAHDLRNPMTIISGYAQVMSDEADAGKRKVACDRIVREVDEMTAMIADLLAFARGDSRLNPMLTPVQELGREVGEYIRMLCSPRGIDLTLEAANGTVFVDAGRAKRVIFNLAKNAVQVLTRGGKLTITLGIDGKDLTVLVGDNGPGLPPEVSGRLFQPFTTAGKKEGTGLGLSIVKRFVDDHCGAIDVVSEEGKGTTFRVRLRSASTAATATAGQRGIA